jgi:hypothetical protein
MKNRLIVLLFPLVAGTVHHTSHAQITLRGMVADSASMQPVSDVNIINKTAGRGAVSDFHGGFSLEAVETDTIVFSRVGYYAKTLPAQEVNKVVIIFLKEQHTMLKPVQIEHKQSASWLQSVPAESTWKNPTFDRKFTETSGFQGIQTFGPGHVFKMPGSGFRKEARAKQRLNEVREENDKARDYIRLVDDAEFKGRIMNDYHLAEGDYYRILARFNEKNKDFLYRLELDEVIPLLIQFYADNTNQK